MSPANEKGAKELQALKADWIAKVVRDPARPAGAATLTGYLADSARADHVRLYTDHELTAYVDIPADDVLHAQRLPAEQSPLGEVIVWVKRDAKFVQGAESAQAGGGSWFEGPIVTDQYAAAATLQPLGGAWPGGGWPGGGLPQTFPPCGPLITIPPQCPIPTAPTTCCPITVRWACPPLTPFCPPLTPACPRTPLRPCITQPTLCRTVIGCPPRTPLVLCHTVPPLCLRTPVVACVTQNVICQTPLCPRSPLCPQTAACPVNSAICPVSATFVCTGACPSMVDACPSAPGGCDTLTTVINPVETVMYQGLGAYTPPPPGQVINPGGWNAGMFG